MENGIFSSINRFSVINGCFFSFICSESPKILIRETIHSKFIRHVFKINATNKNQEELIKGFFMLNWVYAIIKKVNGNGTQCIYYSSFLSLSIFKLFEVISFRTSEKRFIQFAIIYPLKGSSTMEEMKIISKTHIFMQNFSPMRWKVYRVSHSNQCEVLF